MSLNLNEKELFIQYVSKCKEYFEFGAGWTTIEAKKLGLNITTVEGDDKWKEFVIDNISGNICWVKPNIGPIREYGYPVDGHTASSYPRYSECWKYATPGTDIVMIDGRFRVACCLQMILEKYDGIIMIHDFDRPEYWILNKFLDKIDATDRLCVFKVKKDFDFYYAKELLLEYKYNPK